VAAALDCRRALALIREVAAEDPGNADLWFGLGLFDYFADVLPLRHPVLRPVAMLLPEAKKERGVRRLEQVVARGRFARTEAAFFLLQIEMFFEDDYEGSLRWVAWLRREHPGNAVFHELEGRLYARWGRRDRARAVFRRILERYEAGAPGYTLAQAERSHYVIAVCDMRDGDHRSALGHLVRLEGLAPPRGAERPLRTLATLRQGMAFDALGERGRAVSRYRQVLAREEVAGSHERAREHLRSPFRGVDDEPEAEPAS
jgi:tetratricopeptide (TPR) repeat protein